MEENILTAEKAREIALNWENDEVANSRRKVLATVKDTAERGGLSCGVYIYKGRPKGFYDSLEAQMKKLGYLVNRNDNAWGNGTWTFSW